MVKYIIIAWGMFILGFAHVRESKIEKTYCQGFVSGYQDGYCFEDIYCIKPVAPICPVPVANFDKFKDGYRRGFKMGLKARENE